MCEYESSLEQMRVKLAATENELFKSQHLVSSLRKEVGSHATAGGVLLGTAFSFGPIIFLLTGGGSSTEEKPNTLQFHLPSTL